jgi:hypothetical protein
MLNAIGELLRATVPGGFRIATKTYPLAEVESVWAMAEQGARAVFAMSV